MKHQERFKKVIEYQNLHWESLDFINRHLYQRIRTTLLNLSTENTLPHLNVLETWSALIRWKTKGEINEEAFQALAPQQIPTWLIDDLNQRAVLKLEHSKTINVHPHTFFEAVLILVSIAEAVGKLNYIMLNDATAPREGVWLRIVYMPPEGKGYASKTAIGDHLRSNDILFNSLPMVADLFALNKTRFGLQNNTRTGHQAFAVLLPAAPKATDTRPQPPTKLEKIKKLIAENATALNLSTTPAEFSRAIGVLAAIHAVLNTSKSEATQLAEINQILDKCKLSLGPSTTGQAEKVLITVFNLLERKLPSSGEESSSADETVPSRSIMKEDDDDQVEKKSRAEAAATIAKDKALVVVEVKEKAIEAKPVDDAKSETKTTEDKPTVAKPPADEKSEADKAVEAKPATPTTEAKTPTDTTAEAESTDTLKAEDKSTERASEPTEDTSKPNNIAPKPNVDTD